MARPLERLKPIGFWSYARQDDEMSDGQLSRLRFQLAAQLQLIYGKQTIKIFQDVAAIPPGTEWETAINAAIDQATFFIPILTPAFLESEWCCKEVDKFLKREAAINAAHPELQGKRRIFPIRYIQSRFAEPFDANIVAELAKLQETDFTALQRETNQSPNVRDKLVTLADALAEVLQIRVPKPLTAKELEEEGRARREAEQQIRVVEAARLADEQRQRDEAAKRAAEEEAMRAEAERAAQVAREKAEREAAEERAAAERAEREAAAQQAREAEKARLAAEERQRNQADAKRAADEVRAAERAAAWARLRARGWEWRFGIIGAAIVLVIVVLVWGSSDKSASRESGADAANSTADTVVAKDNSQTNNVTDVPTPPLAAPPRPIRPTWIEGNWEVVGSNDGCIIRIAISPDGETLSVGRTGDAKPYKNKLNYDSDHPDILSTPGNRYEHLDTGEIRVTGRSGTKSRIHACVP